MKPKPRGINLHKLEVQALLNGATQLRVPIKTQPPDTKSGKWGWITSSTDKKEVGTFRFSWIDDNGSLFTKRGRESCVAYKPPVQPGQIWFGREPWRWTNNFETNSIESIYKNDFSGEGPYVAWLRANQMAIERSRIVRKCVIVRVERLQEISEDDLQKSLDWSSYNIPDDGDPWGVYFDNWNKIHGPESWQQNPWVWVIESDAT